MQLESGLALRYFYECIYTGIHPNGDPAGEGWSDHPGFKAVHMARVSTPMRIVPPERNDFNDDDDTDPIGRTVIGPMLPLRRPAKVVP